MALRKNTIIAFDISAAENFTASPAMTNISEDPIIKVAPFKGCFGVSV